VWVEPRVSGTRSLRVVRGGLSLVPRGDLEYVSTDGLVE
jgi:hypothetical protein